MDACFAVCAVRAVIRPHPIVGFELWVGMDGRAGWGPRCGGCGRDRMTGGRMG